MPSTETDFKYLDPRGLEGDPFQVASAAFDQALAVGELYETALSDAFIFARNAEMERECQEDGEPNGAQFPQTALGRQITTVQTAVGSVQNSLGVIKRAATYNPRKPPTEANYGN